MVNDRVTKNIVFTGCCSDPECEAVIVRESVSADDAIDLMIIKNAFSEDPQILLRVPLSWYEVSTIMMRWLLGRNAIGNAETIEENNG